MLYCEGKIFNQLLLSKELGAKVDFLMLFPLEQQLFSNQTLGHQSCSKQINKAVYGFVK